MTKRWCQAGDKHIWVRQDWSVQLCCSLSGDSKVHRHKLARPEHLFRYLISPEFKEKYARLKKGPLPAGACSICQRMEGDTFQSSQRFKINKLTEQGDKFFLKLDFSNKCNLKCTMCSSARSTSWIKDEQKLVKALKGDKRHDHPPQGHDNLGNEWFKKIPIEWFKNLGAVEISGGEPLYDENALEFIEFLSINCPTIAMRLITNTTMVNKDILEILARFPKLRIICSVDAWENKTYQYVRGGIYELDEIKENIIGLLENCNGYDSNIAVADTIHPANYNQTNAGRQWVTEINEKYNRGGTKRPLKYSWDYVFKPLHLDPRTVLPKNFIAGKKSLTEQINFYNFTTQLDIIRKQSILDVRREFEPWWKDMENIKNKYKESINAV